MVQPVGVTSGSVRLPTPTYTEASIPPANGKSWRTRPAATVGLLRRKRGKMGRLRGRNSPEALQDFELPAAAGAR
jgi:hypothetical protein